MPLPHKPDKSWVKFLLLSDIQPLFEIGQILLVYVLHVSDSGAKHVNLSSYIYS